MAKKKASKPAPVAVEAPAPVKPAEKAPAGSVLVLAGYDADGLPATSVAVPDEPHDPQFPQREVHIGGQPYVHTIDAPDGAWIYAPRDAKHR